jgi:type IV pilus assembly protein PilW
MKFKRDVLRQSGFSLIEVMVGLVLGLLVALIIVQVMSLFQTQRRTTTGTADAQTNGSIGLFNIGRELQIAGYPLMPYGVAGTPDSPLECTTVTYGATGITSINPVSITEGVAGATPASDSITIRYGNSMSGGSPSQIGLVIGNVVSLQSNLGCVVGDITFADSGNTCALSSATAVSTANTTDVTLQNIAATSGSPSGAANLSCLGIWNEVTYSVNAANSSLDRSVRSTVNGVLGAATTASVVAGVVNLQAQYGIAATATSNQITQWVDATAATGFAAPSLTDRNRIRAVRIAVIARNAQPERNVVTTACSSRTAAAPTGLCAWDATSANPSVASAAPLVDLNNPVNANWAKYHYRVYETIIPLRNMVWTKATL